MAVYPTHDFDETEIKFRYGERYISEAANRKFMGIPRGVYTGFTPSVSGNVLSLDPDTVTEISLARVTSQDDDKYSLDVITDTTTTLDFAGHVTYPVNLVMRASGTLGQPHSAAFITQTAAPLDPIEILICKVTAKVDYENIASGPFTVGETITGGTSGATALVVGLDTDALLTGTITSGPFTVGETITGGTSGATAEVVGDSDNGVLYDDPTNRSTPYAHAAAPLGYGFMRDGNVEDLLASVAMGAEIEQARIDLAGTTQVSLGDRLDVDAAGAAIAERLGKEIIAIQTDDFTTGASSSSLNISRAFSQVHRDLAGLTPSEDITGFASETRVGAITDGTLPAPIPTGAVADSTRNVCTVVSQHTRLLHGDVTSGPFQVGETITGVTSGASGTVGVVTTGAVLVDVTSLNFEAGETISGVTSGASAAVVNINTGHRLVDGSRNTVSGRLSFDEATLTGTLTYNGTTSVSGAGTLFLSEVQGGDIIQDSAGNYYEVANTPGNPASDTALTLSVAAPPGAAASPTRRRFTIVFTNDGTGGVYVPSVGSKLRIMFPMWRSAEVSQFDYMTSATKHLDRYTLGPAIASTAGIAKIATFSPDGQAGAIYSVESSGGQVGSPHIHTIDFNGATDAGGGVVDITQTGPTGPTGPLAGPPGAPGPPGPSGPQGIGITVSRVYEEDSTTYDHNTMGSGVTYSHSVNFGTTAPTMTNGVLFLTGGTALLRTYDSTWQENNEGFNITDITLSGSIGTIFARTPLISGFRATEHKLFLNAAGY